MQVFSIHYRNTQGTLMRILNAVSRRAIDMPYVQATPAEHTHTLTLMLEVNAKQIGQLSRDWHAIVDVTDVRAGAQLNLAAKCASEWAVAPHPPVSATILGDTAANAARA
jgi:acetolactate synthase small subunit